LIDKNTRQKIIIATHNSGKLREFRALLDDRVYEVTSSGELGLADTEETGKTFVENALLKARNVLAFAEGSVAVGEDSGLCVRALGGEPGIHSKRWAEEQGGMKAAMQRLDELLKDKEDRAAFYVCVMAAVFADGTEKIFEGRVDGKIVWPMRGERGFGYDPVFLPDGETRTFAEMTDGEKGALSHRGRALRKFVAAMAG